MCIVMESLNMTSNSHQGISQRDDIMDSLSMMFAIALWKSYHRWSYNLIYSHKNKHNKIRLSSM